MKENERSKSFESEVCRLLMPVPAQPLFVHWENLGANSGRCDPLSCESELNVLFETPGLVKR